MKKILLTIVAIFAMSTMSNAQIQDLGVRIGYGGEVSAMWGVGGNRLETDLGWNSKYLGFTATYQWTWELGSGFNLAMQDLDLRGAGNLLGAEQSGFMEDLGYETYQKILSQAITELKNEEFGDIYEEEIANGREVRGDEFVEDCSLESDLEMYFPDYYVPGSSERMLLYRELDNIESDNELVAYQRRLEDRFGKIPREGVELMQVVPLRQLGKQLGCEKIILKQGNMQMRFVSNTDSPFYRSSAFSKVLRFVNKHLRRCQLNEAYGRNSLNIKNVPTVGEAVFLLREMINETVLTD